MSEEQWRAEVVSAMAAVLDAAGLARGAQERAATWAVVARSEAGDGVVVAEAVDLRLDQVAVALHDLTRAAVDAQAALSNARIAVREEAPAAG